jgi:hypothetical protein
MVLQITVEIIYIKLFFLRKQLIVGAHSAKSLLAAIYHDCQDVYVKNTTAIIRLLLCIAVNVVHKS